MPCASSDQAAAGRPGRGAATAFLFQIGLSPSELEAFLHQFALIPARYFAAPAGMTAQGLTDYLPFLTNMFLHGGWLHLILNMRARRAPAP